MFEPPDYDEKYATTVGDLLGNVLERLRGFGVLRADTEEAAALLTMAGTAFHRLVTVKELVLTERIADAAVLVRSMLELLFSGAYIATAPPAEQNLLGRRFFAFEEVQRQRVVEGVQTLVRQVFKSAALEQALDSAAAEVDDTEARKAMLDFPGIEKSPYWCGHAPKRMVAQIHDPSTKEWMNALYGIMYPALSNFAHPNPVGVKHSVLPVSHYGAVALVSMPLIAAASAVMLYSWARKACGQPEVLDEPSVDFSRFFEMMLGKPIPDESMLLRFFSELTATPKP